MNFSWYFLYDSRISSNSSALFASACRGVVHGSKAKWFRGSLTVRKIKWSIHWSINFVHLVHPNHSNDRLVNVPDFWISGKRTSHSYTILLSWIYDIVVHNYHFLSVTSEDMLGPYKVNRVNTPRDSHMPLHANMRGGIASKELTFLLLLVHITECMGMCQRKRELVS